MYAYTGFPRSLNALGEPMKVVDARKQRGVQDVLGREAGPVARGQELLELGAANQTKLFGAMFARQPRLAEPGTRHDGALQDAIPTPASTHGAPFLVALAADPTLVRTAFHPDRSRYARWRMASITTLIAREELRWLG